MKHRLSFPHKMDAMADTTNRRTCLFVRLFVRLLVSSAKFSLTSVHYTEGILVLRVVSALRSGTKVAIIPLCFPSGCSQCYLSHWPFIR